MGRAVSRQLTQVIVASWCSLQNHPADINRLCSHLLLKVHRGSGLPWAREEAISGAGDPMMEL
jgi:hypothetical protein